MKKVNVLLIVGIMLLMLAGGVLGECTDSDKGKDYYKRGWVEDDFGSLEDYCMNEVSYNENSYYLVEYFCEDGNADFFKGKCKNKCLDGKYVGASVGKTISEKFESWFDWILGYEKGADKKIENCVRRNLIDGLVLTSVQGGLLTPENYILTESSPIAYGYKGGKKELALKREIEKELESYIDSGVYGCVGESDVFDVRSIEELKTKVKIKNNEVYAVVKINSQKYKVDVPVKLGGMYRVADRIVRKEKGNTELVDLGYLTDYGFDVMVTDYEDLGVVVYSIIDEDVQINELPYVFRFAMEY